MHRKSNPFSVTGAISKVELKFPTDKTHEPSKEEKGDQLRVGQAIKVQ
jgi:hypothetical protein